MKPRLFIKPQCGWCLKAMRWLDEKGIAYQRIDVIADRVAFDEMIRLSGQELAPVLEQRLIGLEEDTRSVFDIPAGAAFGERNAELIQWVADKLLRELGDPLEQYQVGDVVQFPTPDGKGSYAGAVRELRDDAQGRSVLFDFNHPLAGRPLRFEVHLIGVL